MIAAAHLIMYATTNKEVIENAVVATFILEIDDYYFKFLITDMIKMDMKAIPALGIAPGIGMSQADATWQYLGSYVLVTTLALGALSLSIGWCDQHGDQTIPMAIVIFLVPLSLIVGSLTYQSTKPWKRPATNTRAAKEYAPLAYRGWRELPPPRDEEEGNEEETREAEGPLSRSQSGKIAPTVDGVHSEQGPRKFSRRRPGGYIEDRRERERREKDKNLTVVREGEWAYGKNNQDGTQEGRRA